MSRAEPEQKRIRYKSETLPDIVQDPGRRFPFVTSVAGFEQLSHLSDEDRRVAKNIFDRMRMTDLEGVEQPPEHAAIQIRNPWMIYQSDPVLMAADIAYGDALYRMNVGLVDDVMKTTDPSKQPADPEVRRRFRMAMLIVAKVAHELRDEWTLRLVTTGPAFSHISKEQWTLLGQSQSVVWDEEQRLILEFAEAALRRTTTDELVARAEAKWGRKQMLRYLAQVTYYMHMLTFMHVNISDAEKNGTVVNQAGLAGAVPVPSAKAG